MPVEDKVRSRGHWAVAIRPETFVSNRISFTEAEKIIVRSSVEWHGWDLPHVDFREPIIRNQDWIELETDWEHHVESWRFYRSGLFALLRGIPTEWRDQSDWFSDREIPDRVVGIETAMIHFLEVFELAARLALTPAGDDTMQIVADARNTQGMSLWVEDRARAPFLRVPETGADTIPYSVSLGREELAGQKAAMAISAMRNFLDFFGWDPPDGLLESLAEKWGR